MRDLTTDAVKNRPLPVVRNGFFAFLTQTFFIGMLVVPTTLQAPRGGLLLLIFMVAVFAALAQSNRCWRVNRDIFLGWSVTVLVGIFGVFWGAINNAPGALKVSTVYIFWPVLYLLFIGFAHDLSVIWRLQVALIIGIVLASLMSLALILAGVLGVGEVVFSLFAFQGAAFGSYDGFIEFRLFNLTTLMYGFPFLFSLLLARRDSLRGWPRFGLWLLLATMFFAALASGRRMFWLVLLITPFVSLCLLQFSSKRLSITALLSGGSISVLLCILIGGVAFFALGLRPDSVFNEFVSAFLGQEASSSARFEQALALWDAFTRSPLIGHGLGAAVEVKRSVEMPWAYELSYLALLMHVGMVGFLTYIGVIVLTFIKGIAISWKDADFASSFVPLATGLSVFLIMNATNPYLAKFDYLWVIFLPVALINAHLTQKPANA